MLTCGYNSSPVNMPYDYGNYADAKISRVLTQEECKARAAIIEDTTRFSAHCVPVEWVKE